MAFEVVEGVEDDDLAPAGGVEDCNGAEEELAGEPEEGSDGVSAE